MTTTQPDHNPPSSGRDVSNLGDYSNTTIRTKDGEELNIQLYGK